MLQRSFEGVSRVFHEFFKEVSRKYKVCFEKGSNRFEEMSRVFEISVKDLSGKFQGSLKTVSRES